MELCCVGSFWSTILTQSVPEYPYIVWSLDLPEKRSVSHKIEADMWLYFRVPAHYGISIPTGYFRSLYPLNFIKYIFSVFSIYVFRLWASGQFRYGDIRRSSVSPRPTCDGIPSASVWPSPRQTPDPPRPPCPHPSDRNPPDATMKRVDALSAWSSHSDLVTQSYDCSVIIEKIFLQLYGFSKNRHITKRNKMTQNLSVSSENHLLRNTKEHRACGCIKIGLNTHVNISTDRDYMPTLY